jgi:hypothetical protein
MDASGSTFTDRVLDDPENFDEYLPPRAVEATRLPTEEDLLRVCVASCGCASPFRARKHTV